MMARSPSAGTGRFPSWGTCTTVLWGLSPWPRGCANRTRTRWRRLCGQVLSVVTIRKLWILGKYSIFRRLFCCTLFILDFVCGFLELCIRVSLPFDRLTEGR
jgi:hypothetical protein